jgi:hypothetical protein
MMTSHLIATIYVVLANVIIFVAAGQVRGGIAPAALAAYYEATSLWQRLVIAGVVYALIIGPFTAAFSLQPTTASFLQAVMGALMVLGLAVAVGGKSITLHMVFSTALVAVASLYLAWAVATAFSRGAAA